MELLGDGVHVRLQSRMYDTYVYADQDGVGVSLSLDGASLNAAWAVHRVVRHGVDYVLFHSAAYGRYLSMTLTKDQADNDLFVQVQRDYTASASRNLSVMWVASDEGDGTGDVVLRNRKYGWWRNPVHRSEVMSWVVEAIPPRDSPPALADIGPPASPGGSMRGRRNQRVPAAPVLRRRIRYVRANDEEELTALVWSTLWFDGRSVSQLREVLANELGEEDPQNITLCVRAGSRGRLTPLVVNLPQDEQMMEIVVFTTGTEAAEALVYPDVGAL